MKICFVIFLLCGLGYCETFGEAKIRSIDGLDLRDTIEKFLKDLQSKIPEVITFSDRNVTIFNNNYINGTINFSNISCTGLKEFNATVIYRSFLPLPKAYVLTLKNLELNLNYKSDITLYNSKYFSLFGDGTVKLNLNNLIFDGNVSISVLPINASTTADVDLENILVNITGLLNDENFSTDFGKLLTKIVTTVFNVNKNTLSKELTKTLNAILQEILVRRVKFSEDNRNDLADDLLLIFQALIVNSTLDYHIN